MILVYGLTLLALLGRVEPHKFSFKQPASEQPTDVQQPIIPPIQAPLPLPIPIQSHRGVKTIDGEDSEEKRLAGVKGLAPLPERPLAYQPPEQPQYFVPIPQPQTLAYVIIRPIQGHYQPYPYQPARQPTYHPAQSFYQQTEQHHVGSFGTKGGDEKLQPTPIEQYPVKSPETFGLPAGELPPPPLPPVGAGQDLFASLDAKKQGKFSKLKSSLEQFAASAKSKLTLGSSYQFVNEEAVPPPPGDLPPVPPPVQFHPVQQQPIEQVKVTQQQIEQENLRENEQQQVVEQQKELPRVQQAREEELTNAHENEFRREQTRLTGQQQVVAEISKGRNIQ